MNKNFFKGKSLLITGGTGSFGNAFLHYLIKNKFKLKKIVVYSRDELKQYKMQEKSLFKKDYLRFFLGDIRDQSRLEMAMDGIDIVVHAAALKQVPAAEYNPFEFIKTNIIGAQNIIDTCNKKGVKNIVALSTDKASSPINLYGATKLCSDKLFTSAQNTIGSKNIKFSVVRYGNVFGSRGSVAPKFLEIQNKLNFFPVTDKNMTRFNITLKESVEFVIDSIVNQKGGEIFVPKLPSYRITDLCNAINPQKKIKLVGIRPGEKIHEELISISESRNTIEKKNYFIILPQKHEFSKINYKGKNLNYVSKNFEYNSGNNKDFLLIKEIKHLIKSISVDEIK